MCRQTKRNANRCVGLFLERQSDIVGNQVERAGITEQFGKANSLQNCKYKI